jgi:hypothetical protein
MPRKRRVELHIERREISIFMSAASPPPSPPSGPPSIDGHPGVVRQTCPLCGSPDLALLAETVIRPHLDLAALRHGMQTGAIHYHQSSSGEWWLCSRSLPQV